MRAGMPLAAAGALFVLLLLSDLPGFATAAPGASTVLTSALSTPRQMAYCASREVLMVTAGVNTEYIAQVDVRTGTTAAVVSYSGAPKHASGVPLVDGTGTNARIAAGGGSLAFDAWCEYLYFADEGTCSVRRVRMSDYAVQTVAGTGTCSNTAGAGTAASLSTPRGIALSASGATLYVSVFHGVRAIGLWDPSHPVSDVAGSPSPGLTTVGAADGPRGTGAFNTPAGLALAGPDLLLVAEEAGRRIRSVRPSTGEVTTLAGQYGVAASLDGVGTAAQLNQPLAVAYYPPLGAAFFTQPLSAPFLRRITIDAARCACTANNVTGLGVTVTGPLASATAVSDLALDPARQLLYVSGFTGGNVYAVAVSLPMAQCPGFGACLGVSGGAQLTLDGASLSLS